MGILRLKIIKNISKPLKNPFELLIAMVLLFAYIKITKTLYFYY